MTALHWSQLTTNPEPEASNEEISRGTSTIQNPAGAGSTLSALALLLTGCGATPAGSAGAGNSGQKVDGGTLRYANLQEPPCVYGGWVQQAYLSRQVLDSLVSQKADGTIVPWLAQSWKVSDDQLTWTFTLKDGVKFTDGTTLDAQAVSENFKYWVGGGNGTVTAYIGDYYESSRAVDPLTLEVKLKAPYSPLLSLWDRATSASSPLRRCRAAANSRTAKPPSDPARSLSGSGSAGNRSRSTGTPATTRPRRPPGTRVLRTSTVLSGPSSRTTLPATVLWPAEQRMPSEKFPL